MEELFYGKARSGVPPSTPPPHSAPDSEKKDYAGQPALKRWRSCGEFSAVSLTQVLRELAKIYVTVFKPIEEATKFDVFYSSLLNEVSSSALSSLSGHGR